MTSPAVAVPRHRVPQAEDQPTMRLWPEVGPCSGSVEQAPTKLHVVAISRQSASGAG